MDISCYNPIRPTKAQVIEVETKIASANEYLGKVALNICGVERVKNLRTVYAKNKSILDFDPVAKEHMEWMIQNENKVISYFILVVSKFTHKFYMVNKSRISQLCIEDYVQESVLAIQSAMYIYDGSSKMSTLVAFCAKNRMKNLIYNCEPLGRVPHRVQIIRNHIGKLMDNNSISFEEAVEISKVKFEKFNFSESNLEIIKNSMYIVHQENDQIVIAEKAKKDFSEDMSIVMSIVNSNLLTDIERKLVKAEIDGDRKMRVNMSKNVINERTGRLWTRQALSLHYQNALEKIRNAIQSNSVLKAA